MFAKGGVDRVVIRKGVAPGGGAERVCPVRLAEIGDARTELGGERRMQRPGRTGEEEAVTWNFLQGNSGNRSRMANARKAELRARHAARRNAECAHDRAVTFFGGVLRHERKVAGTLPKSTEAMQKSPANFAGLWTWAPERPFLFAVADCR
jgi:hypothetical protein